VPSTVVVFQTSFQGLTVQELQDTYTQELFTSGYRTSLALAAKVDYAYVRIDSIMPGSVLVGTTIVFPPSIPKVNVNDFVSLITNASVAAMTQIFTAVPGFLANFGFPILLGAPASAETLNPPSLGLGGAMCTLRAPARIIAPNVASRGNFRVVLQLAAAVAPEVLATAGCGAGGSGSWWGVARPAEVVAGSCEVAADNRALWLAIRPAESQGEGVRGGYRL
jgi:hypothetical protein